VLCTYVPQGEEHVGEVGGGGFVRLAVAQAADKKEGGLKIDWDSG